MCFCFSLGHFVLVLFAFVVLGLVSSVLRQEIGWEERLRNYLFCVEWDQLERPSRGRTGCYLHVCTVSNSGLLCVTKRVSTTPSQPRPLPSPTALWF